MSDRIFLAATFSFFGMVAVAYYFFIPIHGANFFDQAWIAWVSFGIVLFFLILGISFRKTLLGARGNFILAVFAGMGLSVFIVSCFESRHISPNPSPGSRVSAILLVTSLRPSYPGQAVRARVCLDELCKKKSRYLVELKHYTDTRLSVGDIANVSGTVGKVEAFETEYGALFDYPRYLWKDAVAYRISGKRVELLGKSHSVAVNIKRLLSFAHAALLQKVKQVVSYKSSPILAGILIGDGSLISNETNQKFRELGLSHILVLSGSNMTILASIVFLLFGFCSLGIRSTITCIVLIVFLFLAGVAPPALRAVIMVGLFMVVRLTGRIGNNGRILCITAFFMIVLNPRILLYDVSFQLSFLATMGLAYISPLLSRVIPVWVPGRGVLSETIGAQIAVTPLILSLSGILSPYSVPLNFLVVPFIPIVMLFGGAGMLVGFVWLGLGTLVAFPGDLMIRGMIRLVDITGTFPGSVVSVGTPTKAWIFIVYIVLGITLMLILHLPKKPKEPESTGTLFA
jgi:ComEC/Rec2-related protein